MINKNNYINDEVITTIALTESKNTIIIKGENKENHIIFHIPKSINNEKILYLNAYSIIIENNYDIEYISYSRLIINQEIIRNVISLIIPSLIIIGLSFFIIIVNCFRYYKTKKRYGYIDNDYYDDYNYDIPRRLTDNSIIDFRIDDNDDLLI